LTTIKSLSQHRINTWYFCMTTEQRLDRLEALAETTLLAIRELSNQQQSLSHQLHEEVTNVVGMVNLLVQNADRQWEGFTVMQSEIRGLQTENRRILERLEAHNHDNN
jgi:hypothetical protein